MVRDKPRKQQFWMPAIFIAGLFFSMPIFAESIYQIGFVEYKKDKRYKKKALYARYLGKPTGRPVAGAETAIKELKFHGKELGIKFALDHVRVSKPEQLGDAIEELAAQGIDFIVTDLDADLLLQAGAVAQKHGVILLNASATETALRQDQCMKNIYHVVASESMKADALAQHLASKKWRNVLALVGPREGDQAVLETFRVSAKRYGLKISDTREYVLGNDPRVREKNNPRLLTRGSHDVIFVADTDGEFARQLPFNTVKPTPVVGAEGLAPLVWHWSSDRFGAPQLEKRFEKQHKRPMTGVDWAAWMSVKMIATSIQAIGSTELPKILDFFVSENAVFDGFKGNRLNFRGWNNQLRQPILLATHNWVIQRAPIEGFLHHKENLDTLGIDESESTCEFQ